MIKRPTWILLVLLVLVVVVYFVVKNRNNAATAQSTPTTSVTNFLINPADGTLQILRITGPQNQVFQMQRDTSRVWVVTQPSTGSADQALAEAAVTQVGALKIITTLDIQLSLVDAGLQSPADTMELTFDSGLKHTIEVGTLTPTGSGYYVRFDSGNLYVVSQAGIDSLLKLLTAPPFPATETPLPTVQETATPTVELATPTITPTLEVSTSTP